MKLLIDGIAYTVKLKENSAIKAFALQNPIERTLKRYADQEYYAPLQPYEAMHLGDINEDIISHLALAGNSISAKIKIVFP